MFFNCPGLLVKIQKVFTHCHLAVRCCSVLYSLAGLCSQTVRLICCQPDQIVGKSPTEQAGSAEPEPAASAADKAKAKVTDGWGEQFDSDADSAADEVIRGADFNEELLKITPYVE
jgi:hypothetical protein